MPTQMPSTGRPPASRRSITCGPLHRAQPGHAGRERADARHHEPVGRRRGVRVGGDRDVGAGPGQRALGGAQVARPVVEDDDGRAGHASEVSHGRRPPAAGPVSRPRSRRSRRPLPRWHGRARRRTRPGPAPGRPRSDGPGAGTGSGRSEAASTTLPNRRPRQMLGSAIATTCGEHRQVRRQLAARERQPRPVGDVRHQHAARRQHPAHLGEHLGGGQVRRRPGRRRTRRARRGRPTRRASGSAPRGRPPPAPGPSRRGPAAAPAAPIAATSSDSSTARCREPGPGGRDVPGQRERAGAQVHHA